MSVDNVLAGPWEDVVVDWYPVRVRRYPGGAWAAVVSLYSWIAYTPGGRIIASGPVRGGPRMEGEWGHDGPACERAADMHLRDRGLLA